MISWNRFVRLHAHQTCFECLSKTQNSISIYLKCFLFLFCLFSYDEQPEIYNEIDLLNLCLCECSTKNQNHSFQVSHIRWQIIISLSRHWEDTQYIYNILYLLLFSFHFPHNFVVLSFTLCAFMPNARCETCGAIKSNFISFLAEPDTNEMEFSFEFRKSVSMENIRILSIEHLFFNQPYNSH